MDSTLSTVIGAVVAASLTASGAAWRSRTNIRTAARLIYAELSKNSAAVRYFAQTGNWVAPTLPQAAWNEQSAIIARHGSSASFEAVRGGYEALEIVSGLADGSLDDVTSGQLLHDAVDGLAQAITELGKIGGIPSERVRETTERLAGALAKATAEQFAPHRAPNPGIISLSMQGALSAKGISYSQAGYIREPAMRAAGSEQVVSPESATAEHIVYDAQHREVLERLSAARWTGQPPVSDVTVNEAYEGLAAVVAFGRKALGRDPLVKLPLIAFVHYGTDFNNAWWDGNQLVLGDGDGTLFGRFSQCLDVIGTEVWAGVPEMGSLGKGGEPGALQVSVRDVFGQLVKQYTLDQTVEEADWVVGAGLLAPHINGVGLRSMKAPGTAYDDDNLGKDPQVSHMTEYVHTVADRGGTRINSGIPNRAFYLVAEQLGGKAWERAGQIWWETLVGGGLPRGPLFADWAWCTTETASARFGRGSVEHQAVRHAWEQVGVPVAN